MTRTSVAPFRLLQFIVLALLVGAGVWVAVAAYSVLTDEGSPDPVGLGKIMLGIWAALAVVGVVIWPFFRNRCKRRAAAEIAEAGAIDGRRWALQQYWVATILGTAIAQGITLLAATGAFATHHPGLLLATLPGLLVIVLLFPTERRFEKFLARGGVDPAILSSWSESKAVLQPIPQPETDRDFQHQVRILGTTCVSFGVMFLVFVVLLVAIFSSLVREMIAESQWGEVGSLLLFVGLPLLVLLGGGVSLIVGGRRFRWREDSGRRILIGTIATYFVAISVSLGLQIAGTAVLEDTPWWGLLMGIGHLLLVFGAVLFLLWRGIVFLRSPKVVELCNSTAETGSRSKDQRP